jgi:hypothetical protein
MKNRIQQILEDANMELYSATSVSTRIVAA